MNSIYNKIWGQYLHKPSNTRGWGQSPDMRGCHWYLEGREQRPAKTRNCALKSRKIPKCPQIFPGRHCRPTWEQQLKLRRLSSPHWWVGARGLWKDWRGWLTGAVKPLGSIDVKLSGLPPGRRNYGEWKKSQIGTREIKDREEKLRVRWGTELGNLRK